MFEPFKILVPAAPLPEKSVSGGINSFSGEMVNCFSSGYSEKSVIETGSAAVRMDLGVGNEGEVRMEASVAAIMGLLVFANTLKLRRIDEVKRERLSLES